MPLRINLSFVIYLSLIGLVVLGAWALGFSRPQIAATAILASFIFASLFFWRFRVAFALLGVALLLALRLLDIPHLIEFASLDIILFLVGMMTVIAFLEERGFFTQVIDTLLAKIGSSGFRLTALILILAAIFSALVGEVVSILFMTATLFTIVDRYKLNPLPYLFMVIFATNIGSAATVVGNPVGVLIAFQGGLTFTDFLRWATPIALAAMALAIFMFRFLFASSIRELELGLKNSPQESPAPIASLLSPKMRVTWLVFGVTLVGLVLHSRLEKLLGLEKGTMLLGVPLIIAGIVLLIEREKGRFFIERKVEWWTLLFFLLLFSTVGALKLSGATSVVAQKMLSATGGSEIGIFLSTTWLSAMLSAILDNVLAIATFIPIVHDLAASGIEPSPLWWGLLFGGTFMGNLTMIGSTANIVALGLLERRYGRHFTLGYWLKIAFVPTMLTMILASSLLYLQLLR